MNMRMHKVETNGSHEPKQPNHARKLNFGQSILTLDVSMQFQGQKRGTLLIDKNLTDIPFVKRADFVRRWVEIHTDYILEWDESRLSPILGSPATEHVETSPVFGNKRKRVREKANLDDGSVDYTVCTRSNEPQNHLLGNEIFDLSVESNKRIKVDGNDTKKNVKRNLFNCESVAACSKVTGTSTLSILDSNFCRFKRRQRKFKNGSSRRKALDQFENKCIRTNVKSVPIYTEVCRPEESPVLNKNSYPIEKSWTNPMKKALQQTVFDKLESSRVDSNMNSILSCNLTDEQYLEIKYKIMYSQKQHILVKNLENSFENDYLESSPNQDSKISEDSMVSNLSKTKLNIEDSPRDVRDTRQMEIESSNEDNDNCDDFLNINSDTDKDLSSYIEDTNTQDAVLLAKKSICGLKHVSYFPASKSASIHSELSDKDSDQTYFSKAEQLCYTFPSMQPSQTISQISPQITELTDTKSSQTEIVIISTETSPRITHPGPTVLQSNLLDSGKKRRKPKRGSLLETLQSTINRQASFVRIWRHQLKQMEKSGTSVPSVTIYVQTCIVRFSRQFLEGIVIEDPSNLLSQKGSHNSFTIIKIMTVPDIVGKAEMKSEDIIQIFPPWEVLDSKELILNVTYMRIVPDNEEKNIERNRVNTDPVKQSIVKQFTCLCIEENKMMSSCTDRSNKPNVIEKLFIK